MTSILSVFAAMQETTQAPSSGPGSFFLIQMGLIFAIIYFLLLRPRAKQEKQLRERVAELRKGDEVVTTGDGDQAIHLFVADELLGLRLLSLHNVRFLIRLAEQARQQIAIGRFASWHQSWIDRYNNRGAS